MASKDKTAQDPSRKAAILERRALVASVRGAENGVTERRMPAVQEEAKAVATQQVARRKSSKK